MATLNLAGFQYAGTPLMKNWKSSVLLDHSGIVHPGGSRWSLGSYIRGSSEGALGHWDMTWNFVACSAGSR